MTIILSQLSTISLRTNTADNICDEILVTRQSPNTDWQNSWGINNMYT